MFVEPSRSTCTWVEKCDMSTLPSEILRPQKDSTWISISNRSAWNKGGFPAGSRPCNVRPSNRRCKARHLIWKLPSSTRAPVAFSSSSTTLRRAQRSASPLPTMYASARARATAAVAHIAIPCFQRNFLFLSLIFTRTNYRASRLRIGQCHFDLQPRFCFIQPFCGEVCDRVLREQFADLPLDIGEARRGLILPGQLRQQFLLIIVCDIGGLDLRRRAKFVIDITLDIDLPRKQLPNLRSGQSEPVQLRGVCLGTSELRDEPREFTVDFRLCGLRKMRFVGFGLHHPLLDELRKQPVVALRAPLDQLLECPEFTHLAQQDDVAFYPRRNAIDHAPRLSLRCPARHCRRGSHKQQGQNEDGSRAPHQKVVPKLIKN